MHVQVDDVAGWLVLVLVVYGRWVARGLAAVGCDGVYGRCGCAVGGVYSLHTSWSLS